MTPSAGLPSRLASGGRRIRPDLRPGAGLERTGAPADREEPESVRPRQDPPRLLRPDARHRPGAQLERRTVGDEPCRALERDVDLFLVWVERVRPVGVL